MTLLGKTVMTWIVSCVLLLLATFPAQADIDDRGLSETQKVELTRQAAVLREQNTSGRTLVTQVEQYAALGERIGKAMGGAAKELGVAVNDFVHTPVGKMTFYVIVWKIIGFQVAKLAIGLLWLLCSITLWYRIFTKLCIIKAIEYAEDGKTRHKIVYHGDHSGYNMSSTDCRRWAMLLVLLMLIFIGMLIMFA